MPGLPRMSAAIRYSISNKLRSLGTRSTPGEVGGSHAGEEVRLRPREETFQGRRGVGVVVGLQRKPHAKQRGGRALWVTVDNQDAVTAQGHVLREMHRQRGFAGAALERRERQHGRLVCGSAARAGAEGVSHVVELGQRVPDVPPGLGAHRFRQGAGRLALSDGLPRHPHQPSRLADRPASLEPLGVCWRKGGPAQFGQRGAEQVLLAPDRVDGRVGPVTARRMPEPGGDESPETEAVIQQIPL